MTTVQLDQRQQRIGYAAAAVGAAVFPIVSTHTPVSIGIPILLAGLMAVFVRRGRAPTAGAAALGLSFVPQNQFKLLGTPFILYGFWIMYTASREARAERTAAQAVARAARAKEKDAPESRAARPSGGRPGASKRYTPPAAKRKGR